jgi:hypothetical protein
VAFAQRGAKNPANADYILKLRRTSLVFLRRGANDYGNPPSARLRAWAMDELLDRLVGKVGVDRGAAEKAIGIILAFLIEEGPADKVQALIKKLPGADAAMQAAGDEGFGMGGIMGVGSKLMAAGLGIGQIQSATHEFIDFAGEKLGKKTVGEIVSSVPGIGQFV